ncbi:alpha/beta fold hydrolase [Nocardia sp. CDC159]|uniref:Alpha/beta fold hydrolase n=1 Tax=Nocardia pulmonis TaxID=2951408 RepID=A0A9X2J0V2_9NOCA|nr:MULTISPECIES: alpha/beta fold hydrolase [Nocardia]MCM6778958.1 alpha/beta fold hydrolase [Nocardia pulmonis]MCM6791847.1 alpha/beta fold hydrolase [Nocardia sp. CDC159]
MTPRRHGRLRRLILAAILAIIAPAFGYASTAPMTPAVVASTPAPDTPMRIRYGDTDDTFGDLYLPRTRAPHPVVVLIHGGGWAQHRSLTQFAPHARSLAEHGVAVWNIEYRRVNGAGGWPLTLTDVDNAVDALATVVQNRTGNRLDLQRVHLAGHSAGGQLAAWVAARHAPAHSGGPSGLRVRSATLMAAVLDLHHAATKGHDPHVRKLLGGRPDEVPDRYRIASPIANLPVALHITAIHGDNDRVVSPEHSRRYVTAAHSANTAKLHILPGTGHAEFTDAAAPAWSAAQATILDYTATLR